MLTIGTIICMDTKISAAIVGVLGLLLGSFLSGIGYFYRERYKKRRVINQNIFYLLKMLHIALALGNINRIVDLYAKKLKEHPEVKGLITVDEKTLIQLCNELLITLINSISQKVNEEFKQKFNDSIIELSNVKPVIAYELSKTSYTEALTQEIYRILQNTDSQKNQSKEYIDGFTDGVEASQKHILQELESKLIKGIKNLSWSTSFLIWFSCRHEIYKLKQKCSENKMRSYLDNYFEKTILPLMEKYKNN